MQRDAHLTCSSAVLRRLEAWAQAKSGLDGKRDEEPLHEGQSCVAAAPLVNLNVTSRYGIEVHVLIASNKPRMADTEHLNRSHRQHKLCAVLAWHAMQVLGQLGAAASLCDHAQRETAPLLTESESRVLRQREQVALEDALDQQLQPLREARAVAHQLDAGFDDAPAYSADHPVVVALRVLDQSELGLTESPHWRESSK